MHTQGIRGFTFLYDGGYDGNVIITNDSTEQQINIPFDVLKEFVAGWKRGELISRIEDMNADELMEFPIGRKEGGVTNDKMDGILARRSRREI